MKLYKSFVFLALVSALAMCSCYHEFGPTPPPPPNGNAFVNVTITSTPSSTFSFPSLTWPIGAMNIIDSSGNSVALGGTSGIGSLDLARLQTDSFYLGHATVKAASYTSLQVQFNTPLSSYFYNSSSATLLGCLSGAVCLVPSTVPGFGSSTVTVPITYTATASANTGIRVNFDLSKAVTTTAGMTFDFTQTGAITVSKLPTASSQTTGLDTVDNFTGTVTATTGTTVTVTSLASQARTFTVSSTAEFDDPFTVCSGAASFNCLVVNQNVSLDGVVNTDGSFTAYEVEFLDPAPITNELEGIIATPVTNNSFKMVLT